jgi:hypothetical protein
MGMDQRDYYRDLLRKRSGYVERASFRMPANTPRNRKYKNAKTQKTPKVLLIRIIFGVGIFLFLRWIMR